MRNINEILNVYLVCPRFSAFADETGPKHWNNLRYEHVMKLRQAALDTAREIWADYLLVCYHPVRSSAALLILHFGVRGKVSKLDDGDDVNDSSMSSSAEIFQDVRMKINKALMWRQSCLIDIIISKTKIYYIIICQQMVINLECCCYGYLHT